jgi:hypothetical protein
MGNVTRSEEEESPGVVPGDYRFSKIVLFLLTLPK